ncbi:MAG: HigA family addiction module antidote protein [Deltaproteobacteria bacterium]|nr:HigA family addiction module antidote protein [Deltaproteobacteria bacterium]
MTKGKEMLDPISPGGILYEEFMNPLGLSANQLARDIDVPPGRITAIIKGKRTITADTALRLGKYFWVSLEIWLNLQVDYDMHVAWCTIWPFVEPRVRVRTA